MNWFEILKNVGLAQSQRQGISARQKDEDFVFEDDEEDCTQKIIDEYIRLCQKFYGKTPRKLDMFGSAEIHYKIGDGKSLSNAPSILSIEFPKTDEAKKAHCVFYDNFAQGRNFYPPNPEVNQFYNNNWDIVDDKYSIYTKSKREDRKSPTSNFNYYSTLYGPRIVHENFREKIVIRFENLPEDAWK